MKKLRLLLFVLMLTPLMSLAGTPADSIDYELYGRITYKSGSVVKIQKTIGMELPVAGQLGTLSKSFATELFGGTVTGWMSIGDMKVVAVKGDIITFSLLQELSVVTENGVRKNHFEIGQDVKYEWKTPMTPDEAAYLQGQDTVESDIDQALAYYRQAVSANPQHAKSLNMIGIIMNEKEQTDTAYVYFKRAADIDTLNLMYAKNVCISAYKAGNLTEAFTYANKAVICDAKDGEAYYMRGLMYYLLNKEQMIDATRRKVLSDVDKAIEFLPEDPYYYSERAFLRGEFGDAAGACEDAKKAAELGSENGDALIQTYCQP